MKKQFVILFILTLFLVSCSANNPPSYYDEYNITTNNYIIEMSEDTKYNFFKDSIDYYPSESGDTKNVLTPIKSTIKIGKQEIEAYHTKTLQYETKSSINVYSNKDNNIEYKLHKSNNSFSISAKNDTELKHFDESTFSEEVVLEYIKEYMNSYIDIDILNSYSYECTTSMIVHTFDATSRKSKNYFCIAQNDDNKTEDIIYYQFEFIKYYNDIATSDFISVRCNSKGGITHFSYYDNCINWGEVSFDKNLVQSSINSYFESAISSPYSVKNIDIKSQTLVYRSKKIQLSINCDLVLIQNNNEIVIPCSIMLSCK